MINKIIRISPNFALIFQNKTISFVNNKVEIGRIVCYALFGMAEAIDLALALDVVDGVEYEVLINDGPQNPVFPYWKYEYIYFDRLT